MRWSLVADIGGTNARFAALIDGDLESRFEFYHSVDEYPAFSDLIVKLKEELATVADIHSPPAAVCLGVACPADAELIAFTNSHWSFTRGDLVQWLNCEQVAVINDFEAVAHGITALTPADYVQIGGAEPVPNKAIGLIEIGRAHV